MTTLKKIDKTSSEGAESSLNIFDLPPTNVAINKSAVRELLPLSTITNEGPYIFRIFADNQFVDLSKTWLYLETCIEVKNKDGEWGRITDADKNISVIQSLGQSIVRQLKISLNNVECFDSGPHYAYKSYILQELGLSEEVKSGLYQASGYIKDDDNKNGFKKRGAWFSKGYTARFMSKLNFDLGQQPNYILNNTDILFTLYRNNDDFLLLTEKTEENEEQKDYRLKVLMVKLYVKTVDVTQSLNNAISKHLEKTPAKYGLRKIDVRSVFVGKGRQELSHNIFSSVSPRFMIIGFVASSAFSGNKTLSPFVFEHADVRSISVESNGQAYPSSPYQLNFAEGNYIRAFVDMYAGLGLDNGDKTCGISLYKYKTSHCFFVIPMTSTLDNTHGFELIRNGTTCIKVTFNKEVPDPGYEMIVVAEFDQVLTINRDRVLTSDGSI